MSWLDDAVVKTAEDQDAERKAAYCPLWAAISR